MNENRIAKRDLFRGEVAKQTHVESRSSFIPRQFDPGNLHAEETLDARLIIEKLLKRKLQILIVVIGVLIPAAITTFLATPLYRSTVLIQVALEGAQVLPFRDVADFVGTSATNESTLRTEEQILKSTTLHIRVAQRLNSEAKEEMTSGKISVAEPKVEIRRIENSQLFQISYLAPLPEYAANVVNLYAEEYIKQHYEARQAGREKARQALQKELETLEKRVQLSEKELVQYAKNNNIMSLDSGQVEPVQKKMAVVDQQLAEIEAEQAAARSRMEATQKASASDFPEKYATPVIQNLTTTLFQSEHELTAMRASFGENWPAVIQKRNEIELVKDQLAREKSAVLAQAREQARLDLQAVESKRRMMSRSLSEQKGLVNRYHDASIQYNILRREVETNRKLYEGLLERLKQTGVMAGLEFGNIQVIEPGRPDFTPDSPKVTWNLGLASLLGLAFGVCFAFLSDLWDNSLSTLEEAEQLAAIPGLGSVPLIRTSRANPLALLAGRMWSHGSLASDASEDFRSHMEFAESMRTLVASVLLSRSDREPRVIMFTSATPAEGKTTVVSHLGRTLADNGFPTLLVEADLRKPDLARAFGIGEEEGLSLFLAGHVSPLPKIHKTDTPNLFLISAGPRAPNPVALLNSEKMSSFLNETASSFKFILLDAAPVLAVSDARLLACKADGVVLVVRARRTGKNVVRRAWALLENSGANVLGMVLNGAEHDAYSSSYYHYYQQQPIANK
jgi:succinoglycan biosynthesis transport protein ExoP